MREISIRKVLGASVGNIAGMLSKDFLKLVIISVIVAFPLAWWGMHTWLQSFAYRTDISWWIFILAGMIAATIALLTISFQAMKAAMTNPVDSLRTE
jgi:putative ABC transport system permease protein